MQINPLTPIFIAGDLQGLQDDVKPFMLQDQAFSKLRNAYSWRNRLRKREGLQLLGRLRRIIEAFASIITYGTINGTNTFNIFTALGVNVTEPNAMVELGNTTTITIVIAATGQTLTNTDGTSTLIVGGAGNITSAWINYSTGIVTITANAINAPAGVTISLAYYPGLPVMGIIDREIGTINAEETIYFDTKYSYVFVGTGFQDFDATTTWTGDNWNLFWGDNYRGSTPDARLLFVTNNVADVTNPIRYTSGGAWTSFIPLVDATHSLFQTRLIIAYYGRLLFLNVREGVTAAGVASAANIFNRCRFSAIGDLTAVDAWRSDIFGKGGFIDAPTNEAIVSCSFFKNTLIVNFERSTWQLRYVGEYGLPFLWERISSDFGSDSTFSDVIFDAGVLTVGDRAITTCSAVNVQRIDIPIPDLVFTFRNLEHGIDRVTGHREFRKELVYWNYVDPNFLGEEQVFPNKVLVYNYRNNTWAQFDDRVTCFGTFQPTSGITWNRSDIFWNDDNVLWGDFDNQSKFPFTVAGNSQGYVHYFAASNPDDVSYSITAIAVDGVTGNLLITVPNHTMFSDDIIKLSGLQFVTTATGVATTTNLNDEIYQVQFVSSTQVALFKWDGTQYTQFTYTPSLATSSYAGGGQLTFYPRLIVDTKDFNPFQTQGMQTKLSYVDFLMDATPAAQMTVEIFVNSSQDPAAQANMLIGNIETETTLTLVGTITGANNANPGVVTSKNHGLKTGFNINITNVQGATGYNANFNVTYLTENTFSIGADATGFGTYTRGGNWVQSQGNSDANTVPYIPGADYSWHRFFAGATGQYIRIKMTYDEVLMNNPVTHQDDWVMNAFSLWVRPGSKTFLK